MRIIKMKQLAPKITCADGTTLSVQASRIHYCSPKCDQGPYKTVEVGFPSVTLPSSWEEVTLPSSWEEYYDGLGVYCYVPVDLVREFIEEHGGEVGNTFARFTQTQKEQGRQGK